MSSPERTGAPSTNPFDRFDTPLDTKPTGNVVLEHPSRLGRLKEKCCTWKAYDIARVVLGLSVACIALGVLIVYFPSASHIFFSVLSVTAVASSAYLLYVAFSSCSSCRRETIQRTVHGTVLPNAAYNFE